MEIRKKLEFILHLLKSVTNIKYYKKKSNFYKENIYFSWNNLTLNILK